VHKVLIFALLLSVSLSAAAQDDTKNELGLLLGAVLRPDANAVAPVTGRIDVKQGLTYQANYARKLGSPSGIAFHLEFPFVATPSADVSSTIGSVPRNYASIFVTPAVRFTFAPDSTVRPWVSVGGGYGRFDESSTRVDQNENTGPRGKNTGALQFGGGVDIKSPFRVLVPFSFRGEVRDFYSSTPLLNIDLESDRQHNVIVSGGIIIHF
jgi:hypothetical protein